MKKYLLPILLAVIAIGTAQAVDSLGENNDFYLDPEDVVVYQETGMGTIRVCLNNESEGFNSFMMDFYLPEGFTVQKNARGNYKITWNNDEDTGKVPTHTMYVTPRDEGFVRMIGYGQPNSMMTGDDWLFEFNIVAPEGYFDNDPQPVECYVKNIEISDTTAHYMDDIAFTVIPDPMATGIENVEAAGNEGDEWHDLGGRRISAPGAPGLYLRPGRKVIVK